MISQSPAVLEMLGSLNKQKTWNYQWPSRGHLGRKCNHKKLDSTSNLVNLEIGSPIIFSQNLSHWPLHSKSVNWGGRILQRQRVLPTHRAMSGHTCGFQLTVIRQEQHETNATERTSELHCTLLGPQICHSGRTWSLLSNVRDPPEWGSHCYQIKPPLLRIGCDCIHCG